MVTTRSKRPLGAAVDNSVDKAHETVQVVTKRQRRGSVSPLAGKENAQSTTIAETKTTKATTPACSVDRPKSGVALNLAILQEAKYIFRVSTAPSRLIGRDRERTVINEFFDQTIRAGQSGSLYISGAPGTGKTALVELMLAQMKKELRGALIVKINCMTVGDRPRSIYSRILNAMGEDREDLGSGETDEALLDRLFKRKSTRLCVLLLDEIDHLLTKDHDILYRIFGWVGLATNGGCCIIGIANALDLTKRFLPRLQSKDCLPQTLPVPPYDVADTTAIIKDRLASINQTYYQAPESLFQHTAIELCSRKVAATGDLRKALDICCQAIEYVEADIRSASRRSADQCQESPAPLPKVTVQHVLRVLNNVFGAANPTVSKIRGLNPQQKLIVVLIVLIERERRDRKHTTHQVLEASVTRLFDTYLNQCNQHNVMPAVSRAEFFVLLDGIESTGLITMAKGGGSSSSAGTPNRSGCSTPRSTATPIKSKTANSARSTPLKFTPTGKQRHSSKATPTKAQIIDSSTCISLLASEEDVMNGLDTVDFLKELLSEGLPADAFPNAV